MPNPRINAASARANAAKMKAEALKKAKANKVKSKKKAPKTPKTPPTLKTGEVKPASSVKNTKVYKKIKSTSTYKPKLEKVSDEKLEMASPAKMTGGRAYDMNKAYDKNLPMSERFHYLENERHDEDAPGKMKGSPYHMNYKNSPMNITSAQENNLNPALVKEIKKKEGSATQMKGSPYHMSNELKYGGPVIDQMQTLSQASANKVLRHMKK